MENKIINATELGPEIILEASGTIKITGKSRMEDASLYYKAMHEWVDNFISATNAPLTVTLDLSYFNSSSAKQLLKLLMSIDEKNPGGKAVWLYPENNDTLFDRGKELEIMLDLPFEFIPKK